MNIYFYNDPSGLTLGHFIRANSILEADKTLGINPMKQICTVGVSLYKFHPDKIRIGTLCSESVSSKGKLTLRQFSYNTTEMFEPVGWVKDLDSAEALNLIKKHGKTSLKIKIGPDRYVPLSMIQ